MSQRIESDLDFDFRAELVDLPRADQREIYTKTSHGFSVREVVVLTSSGWVKADADEANHRIKLGGVVVAVPDVNTFVVTHKGIVSGFTGLTVGATQYTSSTAGGVSTTFSNRRVGVATSATDIYVGMGFGDIDPTPPGKYGLFALSSVQFGWLECDGSAVSRTTESALFAAIGTLYGSGDGSTTFNLPDLRGETLRGWDNGKGVDSGRVFGSSQDASSIVVRNEFTGHLVSSESRSETVPTDGSETAKFFTGDRTGSSGDQNLYFSWEGGGPMPRNVAVLVCIKT